MEHDLLAELQGYRNEKAQADRRGDADHADEVNAEIERVTAAVRRKAEILEGQAQGYDDANQHVLAGQTRAKARTYSDALAEFEDATDATPTEKAVPRRGRARTAADGEKES